MQRVGSSLVAAFGLGVITVVALIMGGSRVGVRAQAIKSPSPVKVVNTSGDWVAPVPTVAQGTTEISGNVGITGSPSVTISNSPTVQVGNAADTPVLIRDVDNPARQPVSAFGQLGLQDTQVGGSLDLYTVPASKRLVIEFASVRASLPIGETLQFLEITTSLNSEVARAFLAASPQGTAFGQDRFISSQATRLYADPGTVVTVFVNRSSTSGFGDVDFSISGYLVDVP